MTQHQTRAQQLGQHLKQRIERRLRDIRAEVMHREKLLTSLGPEQTLTRGYSIVTNAHGVVIRQATQAKKGETLNLKLGSGAVTTKVTGRSKD